MTIILSTINLKGGVGKTAISVNFAAYCGSKNYKTLLIDLDPQTNASFSSIGVKNWETHSKEKGTVADLLGARTHTSAEGKSKKASEVIYHNAFPNVDLIPSHLDLFTVDLDLAGSAARERKLSKALKPIKDSYDIIICDCPPNLTLPTQNALAISTHYIIPVSLDFLSALGIGILITRVSQLSEDLETELENAGIILSRVGRPAIHREETEITLREQFSDLVYRTPIKERTIVSQAAQQTKSIFDMGNRDAINDFRRIFTELESRIGLSE